MKDRSRKNPILFGNGNGKGILPDKILNQYSVGNCAEVDAVNNALNAGLNLADLYMMTVHMTKSRYGEYKAACENCTVAFKGRIKKSYSGWMDTDE